MSNKKFSDFEKSEQEDFLQVLSRWHQNPQDFEVTAVEKDPPPGGGPIECTVTVQRISTGVAVPFKAGHVSHWVIDFEHALRAKAFG